MSQTPTTESQKQLVCKECNWRGLYLDVLRAEHPFEPGFTVMGCPKCKAVESMRGTCDEPGCWQEDTCGTPVLTGYRRTCYYHMPGKPKPHDPDLAGAD